MSRNGVCQRVLFLRRFENTAIAVGDVLGGSFVRDGGQNGQ